MRDFRPVILLALIFIVIGIFTEALLDYFVFFKETLFTSQHENIHRIILLILTGAFLYILYRSEKKRSKAETVLREERDMLAHIMETIPGGIITIDKSDTITFANAEIENIFDVSRTDLFGLSLTDIKWEATEIDGSPLSPTDIPPYRRVFKTGLPVYGKKMTVHRPGNRSVSLSINAAPVFDDQNNVKTVVVSVEDITGRIAAERQLHLLGNALRSVMDAVVITDLENNILYVNEGFENTYGYSRDEVTGRNISLVRAVDFPKNLSKAIQDKTLERGWMGEIRNRRKDGSEFPLLLSTSVVRNEANEAVAFVGIARDITERVKAQQTMREQREFLHDVIESLTNPFYVINADDYTIALANKASGLVGLPAGTTCYKATHGVDRPCHEIGCDCPLTWVRETGEPAVVEHVHYNAEGLEQVLQVHGFPLKDETGKVVQMIAYDIDLTEVRKSQLLSERRHRQLQAVFDSNPIPLFILDSDRRVRDFNPAAASLSRFDEDDLLGHRPGEIMNCIHHLDVPEGCGFGPVCKSCVARNIVLDTFRTKKPILGKEASFILLNDTPHKAHLRLHTAYFEGDFGPNVLLALDDVTMIKDIENALRESEERYRSLVEAAYEAIVTIDDNGEIVSWNPGAETMFGYEKNSTVGQRIDIIIPSQYFNDHRNALARLSEDRESNLVGKVMELTALRENGDEFPVELSVSRWNRNDKTFYTAIIRDITERKQSEKKLREALARAEQADKLKDAFIANISHEIRTPLNIILGYTDILEMQMKSNVSTDVPDIFDSIRNASQRLMRTVDMILSISQLEAGDVEISPTSLELPSLLEDIVNEKKLIIAEKGLELAFTNDCGDITINADRYVLQKVMDNLLDNAIKFTHKGEIRVRLYFSARQELCIDVQDTGIGISREFQKKIFEPYSQEEMGYSRPYEGIGLGLALVKRYLNLLGADISVSSVKGKGSTFTIRGLKPVSGDNNS